MFQLVFDPRTKQKHGRAVASLLFSGFSRNYLQGFVILLGRGFLCSWLKQPGQYEKTFFFIVYSLNTVESETERIGHV